MGRRITQLSNLLELIESQMITVEQVKGETALSSDLTETDIISTTDFVESIQYLNEAKLFRDGIDFFYEFIGENLVIKVGMKNLYMENTYTAKCSVKADVLPRDIDAKLRETIFSKIA